MPAHYHDDIELLSAEDVERIYRRTDALELHRDWVIVPLNCAATGSERTLPDGKILIRAPGVVAFEPWLRELETRLTDLGLSRTPRRSVDDPNRHLTGTNGPRPVGTRGYVRHGLGPEPRREAVRPPRDRADVERNEAEKELLAVIDR